MNEFLANQFSGVLVQDVANAILNQYLVDRPLLTYMHDLSIDTASREQLINIGYLVGLPWPTVPAGYLNDNGFLLGSYLLFPETDPDHGVGALDGSSGGHLGSVYNNVGDLIPIGLYRLILKAYAILKNENITIHSIDVCCAAIGEGYFIQIPRIFFEFGDSATYPVEDPERGFGGVGLSTGGPFASTDGSTASDIYIVFPSNTPAMNVYVLQTIFNMICTAPRVFLAKQVAI